MAAAPRPLEDMAEDARVLSKATRRAAEELGLSGTTVAAIVKRSRTRLADPMRPDTATKELALMFVRVYRGLYALMGGDADAMHRWLHGTNSATGGVPVEQMRRIEGLVGVLRYVDAVR